MMRSKKDTGYVIGVDMGTQGVRAIAAAADGTIVARAQEALPEDMLPDSSDGIFEQDAEEWWRVTCIALAKIGQELRRAGIDPDGVTALCVSGTSGTFVPLDASYRPLRSALMYSDGRALAEVAICNEALSDLTTKLGYRFNASFALPKLLWLRQHEADTWIRTRLIAHQADYLVGKLTDRWGVSDYTNSLKTGYDLLAEEYPAALASKLDISPERLPHIVSPGTPIAHLNTSVATQLGLSSRTQVVAGLTDGCASQFATGTTNSGEWVSSLGTTLTIKGASSRLIKDPQGRIYCHRHPEHGWLPGGASSTGGEVLARRFPAANLAELDERVAPLVPTSLLTYPLQRRGERFPFVASRAEGFTLHTDGSTHTSSDLFYAACLEGVAFIERLAYEVVGDLGAPVHGPIRSVGGATHSQLWLRIRASVCNRPFAVPEIADPAMGNAVLAAAGRLYPDLKSAAHAMVHIKTAVEPETAWRPVYEEHYVRFKEELHARGYI
jgi:sugar (pentulose or hexulose) kinase